jgi:hypothetical protein
MTRREWLQKNPPPRAAHQLRQLLTRLEEQNAMRGALQAELTRQQQALSYWQGQAYTARAGGDTATITHANSQAGAAQANITEINKQLEASKDVPTQIAQIQSELGKTAKCPTHGKDLVRNTNRPEDMFLCEVGPHHFLWSPLPDDKHHARGGSLQPIDISKEIPGVDEPLG